MMIGGHMEDNHEAVVASSAKDDRNVLLTWDKVSVDLTGYGKSLGLESVLVVDNIARMELDVTAGDVANVMITFYGSVEEKRKSLPESCKGIDMWDSSPKGDGTAKIDLYTVILPLKSLSFTAFPPRLECKGICCGAGKKA